MVASIDKEYSDQPQVMTEEDTPTANKQEIGQSTVPTVSLFEIPDIHKPTEVRQPTKQDVI
jgi:hypothetical protein